MAQLCVTYTVVYVAYNIFLRFVRVSNFFHLFRTYNHVHTFGNVDLTTEPSAAACENGAATHTSGNTTPFGEHP